MSTPERGFPYNFGPDTDRKDFIDSKNVKYKSETLSVQDELDKLASGRILFGASNNDSYTPDSGDKSWVLGDASENENINYPIDAQSRYVYLALPIDLVDLIDIINGNGSPIQFTVSDWVDGEYLYKLYKSTTNYFMDPVFKVSVEYKLPTPSNTVRVGTDNLTAPPVEVIELASSLVEPIPGVINPTQATPYTDVTDLEQVQTEEGTANIYNDQVNKLSFTPPLQVRDDISRDKASTITIDPYAYGEHHVPSYLAYSVGIKRITEKTDILGMEDYARKTDYPNITYDPTSKTFTLIADPNYDEDGEGTAFNVAFKISSRSYALEAGRVKIAVVDADSIDNVLNDNTNNSMQDFRDYKIGYWIGDLSVNGVFKVKGTLKFKLRIECAVGEIELLPRIEGASGVFVQVLSEKESISETYNTWCLDTGTVSPVAKFTLDRQFVDTKMSILADVLKLENGGSTTIPADAYITLSTGEFFHNSNQAEVVNSGGLLNVQGTPFYDIGYTLDSVRTKLLRNQEVRIWSDCRIHYDNAHINDDANNAWFIIAKWQGTEDRTPSDPVTGIQSDGTLTYASGVVEIWKLELFMNTSVQESDPDFFLNPNNTITVPDDTNNLMCFIVPKRTVTMDIDVKNMRIDAQVPAIEYLPEERNIDGSGGFFCHTVLDDVVSDANVLPITVVPVDLYKSLEDIIAQHSLVTNTAPMQIISNPDNTKMSGLQFLSDGQVYVNINFNAVITNLGDIPKRLKFYTVLSGEAGQNERTIHASVRHFSITSRTLPTNCIASFPISVLKGEKLQFFLKVLADDDVWLMYDNGGEDEEGILFQVNIIYLNDSKDYSGDKFTGQ